MNTIRILGIAGSLRKASFNRAALRAAESQLPEGAAMEVFDLAGIPVFDADQERELPERVVRLKERLRASDAVLFVTPEYNYSVPGALKNAIDWGSRPSGDNTWRGRAAAIMGASPGALGTARAQLHLRQILRGVDMPVVRSPEVFIARAPEQFDTNGTLTNEVTTRQIARLLHALVDLARAEARAASPPPA